MTLHREELISRRDAAVQQHQQQLAALNATIGRIDALNELIEIIDTKPVKGDK